MHIIRVIDFETTGMEPPAEVIEVGYCDLTLEEAGGVWTVGQPVSWLCGVASVPPETRAVHHISAQDVHGLAPFDAVKLVESSDGCAALVAHNLDFELKFLDDPILPTICTLKAALRVWPEAPAHSNGVLRYWLEDQGEMVGFRHELAMPPHRAGPDAYVTAWILRALLGRCTGKEMVAWTREPRLFPTCPIGKEWRGKPWADVDAGFLQWMTRQADMEADLKWNANRELTCRQAFA